MGNSASANAQNNNANVTPGPNGQQVAVVPPANQNGLPNGTTKGQVANVNLFNMLQQYPGFNPTYDPNTMSDVQYLQQISPQYSQGFNDLRSQALNQGPSQWLNMSQMHNQMQMDDALNKAQQTSAGSTAAGENNLAASGGLSSGARERLQEQGGANMMNMTQQANRQGTENNLSLEATDQGNRIGQLNNLVTAESTKQNQWNQAKESDVAKQTANTTQLNSYNMNLYNTRMSTWAAQQQANATRDASKK